MVVYIHITSTIFVLYDNTYNISIASPVIAMQPKSETFKNKERSIVALWIIATGIGPIHYQWEKYDSLSDKWILPSSRAVGITSSNLTFSIITEEDEGIYHCIVNNDDGHIVSDNANIIVYGKL